MEPYATRGFWLAGTIKINVRSFSIPFQIEYYGNHLLLRRAASYTSRSIKEYVKYSNI